MKKSMIFAAMAAVALVSCNNNDFLEEGGETTDSSQRLEIKVGQSVDGITKAVINNGSNVTATIIATNGDKPADWVNGFKPITKNGFEDGADWDDALFANVATGSFVAGETEMKVSMTPNLFANPNTTTGGATLTGVAPVGKVEGGKVVFDQLLLDGQQDVMIAKTTAWNKPTGTSPTLSLDPFKLEFEHKTAQLRFSFAAVGRAATGPNPWLPATDNIVVKSITVKAAQLPTAVILGEPHVVEWAAAKNLDLSIATGTVPTTFGTKEQDKPDFVTVDKVAMVKPKTAADGTGEIELSIVITVNGQEKVYSSIVPKLAGSNGNTRLETKEGHYHDIKLTIKKPATPKDAPEITASATVKKWEAGDSGEAELN